MTDNNTDFSRSFGRLEGKVDEILRTVRKTERVQDELDDRITSLETWRSYLAGAVAAVGTVVAILWDVLHS